MARRRAGHSIDPPFKPFKGNADEGNNRRGAIAPAVIAMAKTCPAWLAAEAECHPPAQAMSFCRVGHDSPHPDAVPRLRHHMVVRGRGQSVR